MGPRDRLTLALIIAVAAAGGCKRSTKSEEAPPPPPDRLAPNEVPLSKEKAFALPLPRGARVGGHFGGTVDIATDMSPEELANFVRTRVKGGRITAGSTTTTFEAVTVPTEPGRVLTIEVRPGRTVRSEMIVQDVTPVIDPKAKTDEDRWRAAGYDKDGNPISPSLLH
jgi:hypothetical protein